MKNFSPLGITHAPLNNSPYFESGEDIQPAPPPIGNYYTAPNDDVYTAPNGDAYTWE